MKKREKKIVYPIHKMGKYCGYDEHEDGSIVIAPQYVQRFSVITTQERSVDRLLKAVTEQCHNLLVPIIKEKERFWSDVIEDYGFDADKYIYTYNDGTITRKEKWER